MVWFSSNFYKSLEKCKGKGLWFIKKKLSTLCPGNSRIIYNISNSRNGVKDEKDFQMIIPQYPKYLSKYGPIYNFLAFIFTK